MAARAEASERLSGQIVASLTAGLVVTDLDGRVQIVNPSSRRLLGLGDGPLTGTVSEVLGERSPLTAAIEECLRDLGDLPQRVRVIESAPCASVVTLRQECSTGSLARPVFETLGDPYGIGAERLRRREVDDTPGAVPDRRVNRPDVDRADSARR